MNRKGQPPKILMRQTAALVPFARNARTHSEAQVDQIAASIREFGFTNPVLIDKKDGIIAGHGRVLAALKLSIKEIPCIVLGHLTQTQRRAYVIADNKLALGAGWDDEILAAELTDLQAEGVDLTLLGFDSVEIAELIGENDAGDDGSNAHTFTEHEHRLLNAVWRTILAAWAVRVRDAIDTGKSVTPNFTRESLQAHFLRARFLGKTIPRNASLAYCPHRLEIKAGTSGSLADMLEQDHPDSLIQSIRWGCLEQPSLDKLLSTTLAFHAYRLPGDFPAELARDLIDEFCLPGGSVLDPCHGWGGRLLGFMLSTKGKMYTAYDVDPRTHVGVQEMANDLVPYVARKRGVFLNLKPFEKANPGGPFDFALTSPPYYDVEKYGGEDQSWKTYATFDEWADKFYRVMIETVAGSLRKNAAFALQVGSQTYPLVETAIRFAAECKLAHVETRTSGMVNNYTSTADEDGECIVIFKRK